MKQLRGGFSLLELDVVDSTTNISSGREDNCRTKQW